MREIKFRAWSKKQDKMIKPDAIWLKHHEISINTRFYRDIILMQYTELKDKNGKEIWEGDVVKWINLYGEVNIGWVRYTKVLGGFSVVLIKGSHQPFYTGMVRNFGWSDLKVIGNIFDNPELKGGKE